ncbi:MAG: tetratricopeptide repeat protein [Candidatus Zixiibacteriota bacterium]
MRQGQTLFWAITIVGLLALGCGRSYQTIQTREVSTETLARPESTNPTPSQADSLQKIGERQFHTGKYELASQTFYNVIVQSPDNWKARYYLGLIATENGEFAVAEKWFEQSLTQASYDVSTRSTIYTSRAQMYELSGNQSRALLDYRTAANLDPQNQLAVEALSRLNSSIGSATQPK